MAKKSEIVKNPQIIEISRIVKNWKESAKIRKKVWKVRTYQKNQIFENLRTIKNSRKSSEIEKNQQKDKKMYKIIKNR